MSRVLIVYCSLTGNTEIMADYIAEGVRISGHEASVKKTSDIKNKDELKGFEGYIFGSPTHHRDIAEVFTIGEKPPPPNMDRIIPPY